MLKSNTIYHGDCLDWMKKIDDESIDMILTDLPYQVTNCKWDIQIPLDLLWKEYKRIIKEKAAIVLTSTQPFTTILISSNMKMFKYCWVWNKKLAGNPLIAKYQPLKIHEDICVFSKKSHKYFPQMISGKFRKKGGGKSKLFDMNMTVKFDNEYYPISIIEFSNAKRGIHPTQKPVALFEYLIKTYTNENDLVLDSCAGSFTTAVACDNLKRKWICIEKEKEFCEIGLKRIKDNRIKLKNGGCS